MNTAGQDPTELSTQIGIFVLFSIPALYFLGRACQREPMARRLANLAVGCGLLFLLQPEYAFGLNMIHHRGWVLAIQGIRVLCGLVGLSAGIAALVKRRDPMEVGGGRCATGIVLCCLLVMGGLGGAARGLLLAPGGAGDRWVYHLAPRQFDILVPSRRWRVQEAADGSVVMHRNDGRMQAQLQFDDGSEDAWNSAAEMFRSRMETNKAQIDDLKMHQGTTAGGFPYHAFAGFDKQANCVFHITLVYRPKRHDFAVIVFEAPIKALSQAFRQTEMAAAVIEAEVICLPPPAKAATAE